MARTSRWDRSLASGEWTSFPLTQQVQLTSSFIVPGETVDRVRIQLGFMTWDNGSDYIGQFNALRPVTFGLYFRPAGDVTPQLDPVADRDDDMWMWWQNIPPDGTFDVPSSPGQLAVRHTAEIDCKAKRANNFQGPGVAYAVYAYFRMFAAHVVNSAWYSVGASVNVLLAP